MTGVQTCALPIYRADIWFVKGWLDHQLGMPPDVVLPSLRRARKLAVKERFYRKMLRYFETHSATVPASHK